MKFIIASLLFAFVAFAASKKVPVTIYYEALCPDSRSLIADLGREYPVFKDHLTVKFIPFGRARSLDAQGNKFECHHGPNECVANRIQSCTLEHLKGKQDAQQQFVVCQMRKIAEQTGKECAEEAGAIWTDVSKCIDGENGKKLQLVAETETKAIAKPELKNVPTVTFNDVFDEKLQDKAVKGLHGAFCNVLADQQLKECK